MRFLNLFVPLRPEQLVRKLEIGSWREPVSGASRL